MNLEFVCAHSNTAFEKLAWAILTIVSAVCCAFIVLGTLNTFRDQPVVTSVESFSINQMPFPSVTICPASAEVGFQK